MNADKRRLENRICSSYLRSSAVKYFAGEKMSNGLPGWASEMRDLFRAGSTAQFILHGNVFDVVPANGKQHSLKSFLDEVMFESFDVVLHYDRGKGIRA